MTRFYPEERDFKKKPKAGRDELVFPKGTTLGASLPAGKFEDRIRECEKYIALFAEGTAKRDMYLNLMKGLKEGYSLGKQDMIREIKRDFEDGMPMLVKSTPQWDAYWQALKKREGIE
jgi:hypothetical protein